MINGRFAETGSLFVASPKKRTTRQLRRSMNLNQPGLLSANFSQKSLTEVLLSHTSRCLPFKQLVVVQVRRFLQDSHQNSNITRRIKSIAAFVFLLSTTVFLAIRSIFCDNLNQHKRPNGGQYSNEVPKRRCCV